MSVHRADPEPVLAALRSRLRPESRPVVGVEHEYEVRDGGGRLLDFRQVVDRLPLGRRLDPGDPHAARGPWGGVVTADGAEAEVVTPPVPVAPGAPAAAVGWARRGRAFLEAALPAGTTLTGYSTHISVAVPDPLVRRTARLVVQLDPRAPHLMDRADRLTVVLQRRAAGAAEEDVGQCAGLLVICPVVDIEVDRPRRVRFGHRCRGPCAR